MRFDDYDDDSLLWNKRVSGISFTLSGVVVTLLSIVSLLLFSLVYLCPNIVGCPPSILSVNYLSSWIDIFFGLSLLTIGLSLLALNSRETRKILQHLEASTTVL